MACFNMVLIGFDCPKPQQVLSWLYLSNKIGDTEAFEQTWFCATFHQATDWSCKSLAVATSRQRPLPSEVRWKAAMEHLTSSASTHAGNTKDLERGPRVRIEGKGLAGFIVLRKHHISSADWLTRWQPNCGWRPHELAIASIPASSIGGKGHEQFTRWCSGRLPWSYVNG